MSEENREEELLESELAWAATAESEEDLLDESRSEKMEKLSRGQKFLVGITIFVSFLFFSLLLFPYQGVLRYLLSSYSKNFQLNYSNLDLSFFGQTSVGDLILLLPDRSSLESSQITTTISPLGLAFSGSATGNLLVAAPDLNLKEISLVADSLDSDFNLSHVFDGPELMSGEGTIRVKNPSIRRLPARIPLPISLEDIKIDRLLIRFNIEGGTLVLDGTKLESDLFMMRLEGTAKLSGAVDRTRLNAKLCLSPSPGLQDTNPSLYGIYIMAAGGQEVSVLCFTVTGSLASPRFEPEKNR